MTAEKGDWEVDKRTLEEYFRRAYGLPRYGSDSGPSVYLVWKGLKSTWFSLPTPDERLLAQNGVRPSLYVSVMADDIEFLQTTIDVSQRYARDRNFEDVRIRPTAPGVTAAYWVIRHQNNVLPRSPEDEEWTLDITQGIADDGDSHHRSLPNIPVKYFPLARKEVLKWFREHRVGLGFFTYRSQYFYDKEKKEADSDRIGVQVTQHHPLLFPQDPLTVGIEYFKTTNTLQAIVETATPQHFQSAVHAVEDIATNFKKYSVPKVVIYTPTTSHATQLAAEQAAAKDIVKRADPEASTAEFAAWELAHTSHSH